MKLKFFFKNTVFYVKTITVSSTFRLKNVNLYSSSCNYKSTRPEKNINYLKIPTNRSSDIKITG